MAFIAYTRAYSVLVLGYDHLHLLDSSRRGYKGLFSGTMRATLSSQVAKQAAARS